MAFIFLDKKNGETEINIKAEMRSMNQAVYSSDLIKFQFNISTFILNYRFFPLSTILDCYHFVK